MNHEEYDWEAALSNDPAEVYAHGAATALSEAIESSQAGRDDALTLATIGAGYAALAFQARLGDVADQLSEIGDAVGALVPGAVSPRPSCWQRMLAVLRRGAGNERQADDHEHQGDEHEGQEDGTPIPPRPAGACLRVVGKPGGRS